MDNQEEKTSGSNLKKIAIAVGIILLLLTLISFVGSNVGAMIFKTKALSVFAVGKPHVVLPAEMPFHGVHLSNTMLTSFITILILMLLFISAARKIKLVPSGLQNFVEFFYESLANFIEDTAGTEYGRKFFPVCATIFLFVLFNGWLSLIPGFETIKFNGEPLLRNPNTDINVPMMLAVISFCFVEYWGFKAHGLNYLKKFINVGALIQGFKEMFAGQVKTGLNNMIMGLVSFFTGILEILSEFIRLISFTFRLFGNMTAGMILVMVAIFLVPWVLPSVFYAMEAFFGFIQALIFSGLTLCFLVLAIMSHEEEAH
ncbi:MAG: F0F1 ATP synthase subunit A [Proteobacteria bacterium]|nr:F0F1 ATP synthase subunit A [Pseudomonadota bacterium]